MPCDIAGGSPPMKISPEAKLAQNLMFKHSTEGHLHFIVISVFILEHYFNVVSLVDPDEVANFILEQLFEVKLNFIQYFW